MSECPTCQAATEQSYRFCGMCGTQLQQAPTSGGLTQNALKATDVQYNLAVVYFKMGKFEDAESIIGKILALNPGDLNALALQNDIAEALTDNENTLNP